MAESPKANQASTNPQNVVTLRKRGYEPPKTYSEDVFGSYNAASNATVGLRQTGTPAWDFGNGRTLTFDIVHNNGRRHHNVRVTDESGNIVASRRAKTSAGLYTTIMKLRRRYNQ